MIHGRTMLKFLLNAIYLAAFCVVAILSVPFAGLRRDLLYGFTRNMWGRRPPQLDGRSVIWVHAVSVGEVIVATTLIRRLAENRSDLQIVLSVGTKDGLSVASHELSPKMVFPAPFDFSWAVRRTFNTLNPTALLIAENDFWPNMLSEASERQVPIVIFNTRMSLREQTEHRWNAWLLRPALKQVRWWGAVSQQDAEWIQHFFHVSPARLAVTGSLKFDGLVRDPQNEKTERIRRRMGFSADHRILVAGSIHPQEEQLLTNIIAKLAVDFPQLRFVIVPRHPIRCRRISAMLDEKELPFSLLGERTKSSGESSLVTLVDTMGILRDVWGLADYAFVGGSIARHGGQNPLEPAAYGIPLCLGPHCWNFQTIVDLLVERQAAVQIQTADELEQILRYWLADPSAARTIGQNAQAVVISSSTDSVDRAMQGILSVIPAPVFRSTDEKLDAMDAFTEQRRMEAS